MLTRFLIYSDYSRVQLSNSFYSRITVKIIMTSICFDRHLYQTQVFQSSVIRVSLMLLYDIDELGHVFYETNHNYLHMLPRFFSRES